MFDLFQDIFCSLPLCTVISGQIFVVHGGISGVEGHTLKDIEKISFRGRQPPTGKPTSFEDGIFKELLWNDPDPTVLGTKSSSRGQGVNYFGPDVTSDFLIRNNMQLVIRSHELVSEGYASLHNHKLITIFSASNYCGKNINFGAILNFRFSTSSENWVPASPQGISVKWSLSIYPFEQSSVQIKKQGPP